MTRAIRILISTRLTFGLRCPGTSPEWIRSQPRAMRLMDQPTTIVRMNSARSGCAVNQPIDPQTIEQQKVRS